MVSLMQLWLPIALSAAGVFIASSLIHMVFKWHDVDYRKLPNEDEVRAAISQGKAGPGQYMLPRYTDMKEAQTPEAQQKFKDGPVGLLRLASNGIPNMGSMLGMWFAMNLIVAGAAGYLACKTLWVTATFWQVCRVTSAVTFLAYGAGSVSDGIWYQKPWPSVAKDLLDAAIYAAVTALVFASLWPK